MIAHANIALVGTQERIMTGSPRVPRSRARLAHALRWSCALLALIGVAQLSAYRADRLLVARTAREVLGGPEVSEEQRLLRAIRFTSEHLRETRLDTIEPWTVRLYYRLNPLHPGPGDVLRNGRDYRGGCGSSTRVAVGLLEADHVKARPLLLLDAKGRSEHTVIQAWVDERWVIADPLFGFAYRRRDGRLATVEDLRADRGQYFNAVAGMPFYMGGRFGFEHVTLLNWQKIPVLLPAVRAALVAAIGEAAVDKLVRPRIWMWPQMFYALASLGLSVLALLGSLAAGGEFQVPVRADGGSERVAPSRRASGS